MTYSGTHVTQGMRPTSVEFSFILIILSIPTVVGEQTSRTKRDAISGELRTCTARNSKGPISKPAPILAPFCLKGANQLPQCPYLWTLTTTTALDLTTE